MSDHRDALARAFRAVTIQNWEQRVSGLVTARVDRIERDGTYRLKVFGMNGDDDDEITAPARVMMPMAGARRGFHFFPEPGDEVVVGFHDDDANTPIILGAVWNRDAPPPDQARQSPENDVRTIVSRSGHELTFDDTEGQEKVTIKTQGGHAIELDDAPAGPKITVSTPGGRSVVLDDTLPGSLSVQTPTCQISLREPGTISIEASVSIRLSAPAIELNTTGAVTASAVMIDGKPFGLHQHIPPTVGTPPMTGPVAP